MYDELSLKTKLISFIFKLISFKFRFQDFQCTKTEFKSVFSFLNRYAFKAGAKV